MKKELVILGGGIKGTAVAAIASLFDDFNVTLIERERIGSGATSTNHGRLHLGTAGWETEPSELIQRRRLASDLVRYLPNTLVSKKEGAYCFENEQDADRFQQVALYNKIPYQIVTHLDGVNEWIELPRYKRIMRVPEHSFNPALLAGRFAQTCIDMGGKVLTGYDVDEIYQYSNKLFVKFRGRDVILADLVINTLARWTSTIRIPIGAPKPIIRWFRWQLLCLHSSTLPQLPKLDRVIVTIGQNREMPSAISHVNWITLDHKTTPIEEVPSPEIDDNSNWRSYNSSHPTDYINFVTVRDVFKPLSDYNQEVLTRRLFSLTGIHGRRENAAVGSQNNCEMSNMLPGYIVAFGGQASTGLLDAIEILEQVRSWSNLRQHNRKSLLDALALYLANEPIQSYLPMRWER